MIDAGPTCRGCGSEVIHGRTPEGDWTCGNGRCLDESLIETVEAIDTVRQELEDIRACLIDAEASEAASVIADKVGRSLDLLEGAVAVGTIAEEG